jgi:hypothetical protein
MQGHHVFNPTILISGLHPDPAKGGAHSEPAVYLQHGVRVVQAVPA